MTEEQTKTLTKCLALLKELNLENEFSLGSFERAVLLDMRSTLEQVLSSKNGGG